MVAVTNLYDSRMRLTQQQQILKSGNINESNISLFENTEGLTQGMIDGSCTDGKDDGKLGLGETLKSLGKGAIKSLIPSSPMGWVKAIGTGIACAALVAVTGGAATPFLIAGGAVLGAAQTGKGIYQATQADTDAEKKAALENIGGGAVTIASSALAAKSYTNATGNALVGKGSLSTYKNAATQSVANVKTNFGKLTTKISSAKTNFSNGIELTESAKTYKELFADKELVKDLSKKEMLDAGLDYGNELVKSYSQSCKGATKTTLQNAKNYIATAKNNLNVNQMVAKLSEMGIDKTTAMELITASNTKYDMQEESIQSKLSQYYM